MNLDVALDRLPADTLAHYSWGHYRIWLSPKAAAQASDFAMRVIAEVIAGSAKWRNEEQFACFVSLLHEFVHYQQDVGTGCGHWDELARESMLSDVLSAAHHQSWFPSKPLPLPPDRAQELVDTYATASVFNSWRRRKATALTALRAELVGSPAYTEGAENHFGVDAMFELDAVLSVQRVVEKMRSSARGLKLARGQSHLYSPPKMQAAYRQPYEILIGALRQLMFPTKIELTSKDADHLLDTVDAVAPVLMDIAFAHPPPSFFVGARAADRVHFEPGLRLVRALRSIEAAPDRQLDDIDADIERIARKSAAYEYPSVRSVYEAWANVWQAREDKNALAAWRLKQCLERLKHPQAIERRNLPNVISHGLPLQIDSPAWPCTRLLISGAAVHDGGALYESMRESSELLSLAQWFLGGSPGGYVCPHANGNLCEGVRPRCRSGIPAIWNLPPIQNCQVRGKLHHWGFSLDAPLA